MRDTKKALVWISTILKKYDIPFQITGGLAANVYGSKRPLDDIDIDIPEDKFELVKKEVEGFILFGPERFKSDKWDLYLMTLNYKEQSIDLSGAYTTKVFNEKTQTWHTLTEDLSTVMIKFIFGLPLPVIRREKLLAYKKILSREVDLIDVSEIEGGSS